MERRYPVREHLNRPASAFDAISDELKTYRDGESFRQAILGLNRKYERTAFAESMQEYATNAAYAKVLSHEQKTDLDIGSLIAFGGSMLGLHTAIAPLGSEHRRLVFSRRVGVAGTVESPDDELSQAKNTAIYIQHGEAIQGYSELLNDQDQLLLMMSAERFCQGYDQIYEELFTEGVATSILAVKAILKQYNRFGPPV